MTPSLIVLIIGLIVVGIVSFLWIVVGIVSFLWIKEEIKQRKQRLQKKQEG